MPLDPTTEAVLAQLAQADAPPMSQLSPAAVVAPLARDRGGPEIALQRLVYPVTDAAMDTPSYRENGEGCFLTLDSMRKFRDHYCPADRRSDPRASPLRAEDLSRRPPAVVLTAEFDPLRDEGLAYAERLRAAGVPVEYRCFDGLIHGFFSGVRRIPAGRAGIDFAVEALRRVPGRAA